MLAQVAVAVVLHKGGIVRPAGIGRVEGQMVVVVLQRPADKTPGLVLAADVFDLVQRRQDVPERDVDLDLVIGNDQGAVVRDIVYGVGADRVLAGDLIDGLRQIRFDIRLVLARMDNAVLHAVLDERAQGVFEHLVVADRQHVALLLGLGPGVVRGDEGVFRRHQRGAAAQKEQKQGEKDGQKSSFQAGPSLQLVARAAEALAQHLMGRQEDDERVGVDLADDGLELGQLALTHGRHEDRPRLARCRQGRSRRGRAGSRSAWRPAGSARR